ncbi:MAG: 4-hydroxy-tetrahydrodipicolinate synthase [Bacteriovoracaceae bacterium]|nr:4-hydroxy-tetrahydrodipicolinate synthase [Bacteriovoracaceae bacterium]
MEAVNCKLWTALITPMTEDNRVDLKGLNKLLQRQVDAGNGVLLLGSTGEALNLDLYEQKEILEYIMSLRLDIPYMVGVGGINQKATTHWVEYLESLPIQCYLMVTPLYSKPGAKGQYEWFKGLLDIVTRPAMLYNIPSRTGISLSLEAIRDLQEHPMFWAIKEASGSTTEFTNYKKAAPSAQVFSGDDAMLPQYAPLGASGLVSVCANVWPMETKKYVELALKNELGDAKLWESATRALFCASNPIPVKALMQKLELISSKVLRPPLSHLDLKEESVLLSAHESIQKWWQQFI